MLCEKNDSNCRQFGVPVENFSPLCQRKPRLTIKKTCDFSKETSGTML